MFFLVYAGGNLLGGEVVLKSDAPAGGHEITASGSNAAQAEYGIAGGDDLEAVDFFDVTALVSSEYVLGDKGVKNGLE
tara:strand:- start:1522 stop:1755 length:234 start_codon:yes stop_codon:yes gene_type:complete